MIYIKNNKIILFSSMILLIIFGIIMIYSSSYVWAEYKFNDSFKYVKMQGLFFIVGLGILYLMKILKIDYYKYSTKIFIFCLVLLILVLIPGIGKIRNGSRSWFGIGSFGIQPSEFMKLSLIILTSKYLSKIDKVNLKNVLPVIIVLIIVFGLIMLQPDLGTALILAISIVAILFVAGLNIKYFIYITLVGIIGVVLLIIIAPYRMNRILSFINPWSDPLGTGFQIIQSLYAIGPGGLLGQGFLNSRQKHFYLPEPQTDFIFSIISEEFGILGIILVAGLFVLILYNGFKIALNYEDKFYKYLTFGIVFQILLQCVLNLCVVVGLIPVTGVTLPFLSYGGSSLIITMISIGIIININKSG